MAAVNAKLTNNAFGTLDAGITNVATSLTLTAGQGALFPSLAGAEYFYCTITDGAADIEIVKVTARSTDTLTIVRGQDGTSGLAFDAGDAVELRPIAELFREKLAKDGDTAANLTISSMAVDLAVVDGGTGASTAAGAATNLGLGTGDSPQFTAVNVGHASDTTITRVSAGVIAVEGSNVLLASGIGSIVQAWDAQLDSLSSASANGVSLVTSANYASMRALLDLEPGTDFYSIADTTQAIGQAVANTQTGTTYGPVASDRGKMVTLNNASAITVTVSSATHSANDRIDFVQKGAGQVTFVGSGVTINSRGGKLKLAGQYAGCTIWFESATVAYIFGDLTA